MPHPAVENLTPFAFEALFLADEEGRPLVVPIVKATYDIRDDRLERAEQQEPIDAAGVFWGEPDDSPYKREPETAFVKLATDVFLVGTARPPKPKMTEMQAALRVGPVQKVVDVVGDRVWFKSAGAVQLTKPQPIEAVPLSYALAYGGKDRSGAQLEPRNPCGTGFWSGSGAFPENLRAPSFEDPRRRITSIKDRPPPAGFGPVGPGWKPRLELAGTYDEAWRQTRFPLLPLNFDRRFFNAASADLVTKEYLRGDEPVVVLNASPKGALPFYLPGVPPPRVQIERAQGGDLALDTRLDTVIVDTDEMKVALLWRAHAPLKRGPEDVRSLKIAAELPRGA
jgi:hypothetical protein